MSIEKELSYSFSLQKKVYENVKIILQKSKKHQFHAQTELIPEFRVLYSIYFKKTNVGPRCRVAEIINGMLKSSALIYNCTFLCYFY